MPKELVTAPPAVLDAVIAEVIRPCLRQLETELDHILPVGVSQWRDSRVGPTTMVGAEPEAKGPSQVTGEVRVQFRKNYGGDRYLFRAQALFPEAFTPHRNFSGFQVEGGVDVVDDRPVRVQYQAWTVNWGKQTFTKWY